MGDVSFDEVRKFRTRLARLGPQWTTVDGVPYLCHNVVNGYPNCFIATTPSSYQLFEVRLADQKAVVITHRVPTGNPLPPDRHIPTLRVVQWVAEAWLFDQVPDKGVVFYAHYLIPALVETCLVSPDRLTSELISLLESEVLANETRGRLSDYRNDGSAALMQAWIEGVIFLAIVAIGECDE